jgi:putative selenate reductase
MSDELRPLTAEQLACWVFDEVDARGTVFGIPVADAFRPRAEHRFRTRVWGQWLETPFGVAAGPHSQMAQNIVAAWLCGARVIELKTIQTLDELDVAKPCIDMRDEGYNVEWSQELKVEQSFEEYLRAWVLIHALHARLGFVGDAPGVAFNMSVGYDLAGIRQPNVQWFLGAMADAGEALDRCLSAMARRAPEVRALDVPRRLSDNVTVSTMHGCPPDEIGKICAYLMETWGLHTNVKLNPTLLGPAEVRHIVNDTLGYRHVVVPDEAFAHDLKYPDGVALVGELRTVGERCGVELGVKLCNTLEVVNRGEVFDRRANAMMYLSGRPHHAVAVNVARKLRGDLGDDLSISFAGGVDAWNAVDLLCAGMTTVTSCSDLLRPGGYGRMIEYVERLDGALAEARADDVPGLALARARGGGADVTDAASAYRFNLERYADRVKTDPRLTCATYDRSATKTSRPLGPLDCIVAPCTATCPIAQRVPEYMAHAAAGDRAGAAAVIRADNAMGAVLGRACPHECERRCRRAHYDGPVAIRDIKRWAMDGEPIVAAGSGAAQTAGPGRVAVVGAGPCGLAAARELADAGVGVDLYEAARTPGGMVAAAIPAYRARRAVLEQDLAFLSAAGVEAKVGAAIGGDGGTVETLLRGGRYEAVVLAVGAPRGLRLSIPGQDGAGVLDGLDFLRGARVGAFADLGRGPVAIIGGGDVAMDCARTAARLAPGRAFVLYRRTIAEMPAQAEERAALEEEGVAVRELLSPVSFALDRDGRVEAVLCVPMKLGEPDARDGRRRPVPASDQVVVVPATAVIVAVGQQADLSVLGALAPRTTGHGYLEVDAATGETSIPGLFAGGDLVGEGPSTIVEALADGQRAARTILAKLGLAPAPRAPVPASTPNPPTWRERTRRCDRATPTQRPPAARLGFEEVTETLADDAARREAERCLRCDLACSVCVSVCPNRAFREYEVAPFEVVVPTLATRGGTLAVVGEHTVRVEQATQVAVVADLCNECGNCTTFCPTAGAPSRDKPRLYLDEDDFAAQSDNAFRLAAVEPRPAILARVAGATHRLEVGAEIVYETPSLVLRLDAQRLSLVDARPNAPLEEGAAVPVGPLVTMLALARALVGSLSYLPFRNESNGAPAR